MIKHFTKLESIQIFHGHPDLERFDKTEHWYATTTDKPCSIQQLEAICSVIDETSKRLKYVSARLLDSEIFVQDSFSKIR
jgi:hypothetical protein